MKTKILLMLFALCAITATAQNDCYEVRQKQGIDLFNKGNYVMAKKFFAFAINCAYISADAKAELQAWQQRCDDAIAGKEVQLPASAIAAAQEQMPEDVAPAKPQSAAASKAAERAKREAEARAAAAAKAAARAVEQSASTSTQTPVTQPQSNRFTELMATADSCFNISDYTNAQGGYQKAASYAQQTGNQQDVQLALKKIDCTQQLIDVRTLMQQQLFDEAKTKLISAQAIGCVSAKRVKSLIDSCNTEIAVAATLAAERVEAIAADMVLVEGGIFMMGCENDCKEGETPVHQVVLKNFYIGKHEITQAQWTSIMGNNPSFIIDKDFPVTNVSWAEIQEFLKRINAASGIQFRLPAESEWEYAARGGSKSRHDIFSGSEALSDVAWYADNSGNSLHAIGLKDPNELGIYDMSGNVAEWCSDWRSDYTSGFHLYPVGAKSGTERVIRGGGYNESVDFQRVFFRASAAPETKSTNVGFRIASSSD
ncbi:hypothetical protein FACS189429_2650 [Bacteroidia bacterium]|nr:hypothetical protein FACS189429_2650 [Bacteroidia bacterium]